LWYERIIDLSEFAGQSIHVAFRHFNTEGQHHVLIDDIIISYTGGNQILLGNLTGTVTNSLTGNPIEGASITIVGYDIPALSNAQGVYFIQGIEVGPVTIKAAKEGYEDYIFENFVIEAGDTKTHNITMISTTNEHNEITVPIVTALLTNFPNPFNPSTTIAFSLSNVGNVEINVYNVRGQRVRSLLNEQRETGHHKVIWDGTDNNGRIVGSGIYFYRMSAGEYQSVRRMVLMK